MSRTCRRCRDGIPHDIPHGTAAGEERRVTVNLMCTATHTCTGGQQHGCSRLAHTSSHHCSWCGHVWHDTTRTA